MKYHRVCKTKSLSSPHNMLYYIFAIDEYKQRLQLRRESIHVQKFLSIVAILVLALAAMVGCNKPTVYKDGEYIGVSDANEKGFTRVKLTLKKDKITAVSIVDITELGQEKTADYPYEAYHKAVVDLAAAMQAKNDWDVAVVTGATSTSEQSKQAAQRALEKAKTERATGSRLFDGTFMGVSPTTADGWTIALVTIQADKITDVVLQSVTAGKDADGNTKFALKDESYPYAPYFEAIRLLAERMVEENSADVEAIAGATSTSNEAVEAAKQALTLATR